MLQPGTEYKFSVNKEKQTQGDNRFEISMKPATVADKAMNMTATMAPNPTTDDVKITLATSGKDEVTVTVADITGLSIYNHNYGIMPSGVVNVPLSQFASGIYMVTITSGNQTVTKKLVKGIIK